ncbi:hypothetical protein Sste5346_005610 [Sporothrix stenoceras]|uniref:C6 zinc finger domain containing protein n=1 Tax=Sporothrix stenoceras TaxID=5173 RepID=A0ABR3Z2R4_9PEZI
MFRDESSHVIRKVQARQKKKAQARTPDPVPSPDGDSSSTNLSSSSSTPNLALSKTPTVPSTPSKAGGSRPKALTLLMPGIHHNGGNSSIVESNKTPVSLTFLEPESLQNPPQSPKPSPKPIPAKVQKQDDKKRQQTQQQVQQPHQQYQQQQEQHQQQQLIWTRDDTLLPSPDGGSWPETPTIAQMYTIEPNSQERGTAFFFSRYVTMDENASHQRFDFLYDIWKPGSLTAERPLDGVMASMTAVGLVGISQLTHSEEIIDSARKSYGTALCLTNIALKDPEEAIKDTTMLSILILGVFEMMAEPGLKTMKTWHDHINGAVELAKLRGVSQFRTRAGIRMFNMLCESVTISCMQRQVPMPPALVALQSELLSTTTAVVEHEPGGFDGINLWKPIYKLLQARHDVRSTNLSNNLDELLARMEDIEAEFDQTISSFPPDCYYKVFKVTRPHKAVFRDVCHVYPSVASASVWNWLRSGRILVLETVLSAIQRHYPECGDDGELVPTQYMAAFRQAWMKLDRVNSAIVASIPQHFGVVNPVNPYFDSLKPMPTVVHPLSTTEVREPPTPPAQSPISSAGSVQTPSVHSEDRSEAGGHGGFRDDDDVVFDDGGPSLDNPTRARHIDEEAERYMLLASVTNSAVWPLFAVGVSSVCSPQLKAYVVSRLGAIFDETGLKQARSIAAIVRNRELIKSPWLKLFTRSSSTTMAPPPPVRKPFLSASAV